MDKQMSLCDVCPQPKSFRPCSNCVEVRMGMHASALRAEQEWDQRHKHVNGLEGDGELVNITEYPKISLAKIDPKQVAKYGIREGQIISSGMIVTA